MTTGLGFASSSKFALVPMICAHAWPTIREPVGILRVALMMYTPNGIYTTDDVLVPKSRIPFKAFNQWIADFVGRERNEGDDDDDDDEEWPSDVRRNVCIVVDEAALASLLNAPDFVRGKVPNLDLEPWVTVVDAEDPANMPYRGGAPYMGFARAYVRVLSQLFDDLDSRSLEKLSPIRVYDGQIPLFTGSSQGKLVDPPWWNRRTIQVSAGNAEGRTGSADYVGRD